VSVTSGFAGGNPSISLRRTAVDPADDRVDLLIGQRHVVLEVLDTDARSMCHGIWRVETRSAIERAQGRASWKEMSDIGTIEFG
jgi:hypothetical protein